MCIFRCFDLHKFWCLQKTWTKKKWIKPKEWRWLWYTSIFGVRTYFRSAILNFQLWEIRRVLLSYGRTRNNTTTSFVLNFHFFICYFFSPRVRLCVCAVFATAVDWVHFAEFEYISLKRDRRKKNTSLDSSRCKINQRHCRKRREKKTKYQQQVDTVVSRHFQHHLKKSFRRIYCEIEKFRCD